MCVRQVATKLLVERRSLEKLHGEVELAVHLADIGKLDDRRVSEGLERANLTAKVVSLVAVFKAEHLERHCGLTLLVPGLIDRAHAALADGGQVSISWNGNDHGIRNLVQQIEARNTDVIPILGFLQGQPKRNG